MIIRGAVVVKHCNAIFPSQMQNYNVETNGLLKNIIFKFVPQLLFKFFGDIFS